MDLNKQDRVTDEAIQHTNFDALSFKSYAVKKTYWNDPFISYFAKQSNEIDHKAPEMSRGYFARVSSVKSLLSNFLSLTNKNCQVINIGAGYDTLYFNLEKDSNLPVKYIEIDFNAICRAKCRIIKSKKPLVESILRHYQIDNALKMPAPVPTLPLPPWIPSNSQLANTSCDIYGGIYNLISCDLRQLNTELNQKLVQCGVDFSLPTIIIAECVLVYMTKEDSMKLLKYFSQLFSQCSFINYEQVNLNDRFGQVMIENMLARSCNLLGIDSCMSIETQKDRFQSSGFFFNQVITMTHYYKEYLNQIERKRVENIEFLDEIELLFQLLDHYCICLASNNENFLNKVFFKN